ncbi:nicotinate-nucleotide--dimethylbenzimidazole phosphoribosyltransferase [Glaciimonas immobilis]|uniref:Nicotinate-nucleotide--dimethylbenzimidazole phosphoribosyltransferase n=1 Tax=Glaciimonas immobilis TaxID=728004 RepID=A0A840RUM3_9BURK|nr:nicotinate-nucleotide--dimethylbenzimidazole phosphoribosyltransferase [Glaciimonas immobilis]KAF3996752.1 nicotinate-nucleotide--dimethylbenzimidazole phosphoribosyltransferase [Glaciimonas immobilis]MBB5201323.1 nicotinate-nucleotide--dimethylbenzimidazole phosphoribosyltransferase [Glaciimonas immobilis]
MQIPHIVPTQDSALNTALTAVINNKTKPLGSLGSLEVIALQIGLIQQTTRPALMQPAIVIFAADHGVVAEGISAYPQSVTWQMVENFLSEGAAINVFARQSQCSLHIVDAGVNHDFGTRPKLIAKKVGFGTKNFIHEAAMTTEQCATALTHGIALIGGLPGNIIGFGEMGIGNTTAAAAIMQKITGLPLVECVGAGTAFDATRILLKQSVIQRAINHHDRVATPLEILATFGGFEIAMMVGAMLAAAERRMVLLIDGFIVTSALLIAARLRPEILDYCVFAHCSDEHGHRQMLTYLKAQPLLQIGLRLGEGTGAALALPLVQAAVAFMAEMATFESASVDAISPLDA